MAVQEIILIDDTLKDHDKLIHICYGDSMTALCGYKCKEDVTHLTDEADCIVCVELDRLGL